MELSSRSQRKIDSIIFNASKLFAQLGYHNVTMETIANDSNVSKATLYKYYSDKQKLYEEILMKNYLKEFNEIVNTINGDIPFEQKVDQVVKIRIKKYYDQTNPIYNGEFVLSNELQIFIKKYTDQMTTHRRNLYAQGKIEGYICDDISEETLETYFKVIQKGLVSEFKDLSKLNNDNLTQLLKILYSGVLGCNH